MPRSAGNSPNCVGFAAGPGTQRKLAHAALDSGVKRYFPWQFGVDYDAIGRGGPQDLFDEQLDVRELWRGQDRTEWVIVSTGMFNSFIQPSREIGRNRGFGREGEDQRLPRVRSSGNRIKPELLA